MLQISVIIVDYNIFIIFFQIQETEKKKILLKLISSSYLPGNIDSVEFYKVHFNDALDLIRARRVYLQAGYAYVPSDELVSIVTASFRSHLSHAITVNCNYLKNM